MAPRRGAENTESNHDRPDPESPMASIDARDRAEPPATATRADAVPRGARAAGHTLPAGLYQALFERSSDIVTIVEETAASIEREFTNERLHVLVDNGGWDPASPEHVPVTPIAFSDNLEEDPS